jgi:hypothetical protein
MDSELYKPFTLTFKVFKTLGMWQDGNQTWKYFIFGYAFHFSTVYLFLTCLFLHAIEVKNVVDFADSFRITILVFTVALKSLNFFITVRKLTKFLHSLNELLNFSSDPMYQNRSHVRQQVAFVYKIFKVFGTFSILSVIDAALVPFSAHKLPYKAFFPFNTEYGGIGFWIASCFEILVTLPIASIGITSTILPVVFMSFAIGLVNEVAERLSEIGKVKKIENPIMKSHKVGKISKANLIKIDHKKEEKLQNIQQLEELKKCVAIHKKIKKFVAEIQQNFSIMILIEGFFCSIILCSSAFSLSIVSQNKIYLF